MAVYNITNATGTYDYLTLAREINVLSENVFGITLFIVLATIMFFGMKALHVKTEAALAITGWFAIIFGLIMRAAQLIGDATLITTIVFTITMVALLYIRAKND